jgi:hypothetical protein
MNKEFVPYEPSLALKELGFDEPCFRWYDERWGDDLQQDKFNTNKDLFITDLDCSAPLYQQAFRWFREKYGLYHSIGLDNSLENNINCDYQIINHSQSISELETSFKSYEEAELACLIKLIEIVKNK